MNAARPSIFDLKPGYQCKDLVINVLEKMPELIRKIIAVIVDPPQGMNP